MPSFKELFLNTPPGQARENLIYQEIVKRGPPKEMVPVTVDGPNGTKITYYVLPDVVSIDGIRVPMTANTSQRIANAFKMHLPTAKISKQIYDAADTKIRATPLSAGGFSSGGKNYTAQDVIGHKIGDSDAAIAYNELTNKELLKHQRETGKTPTLIAGHGKDILQPLSDPGRMSIGGWQGQNGKALQPDSSPHDASTQVEYGTWTRLVGDQVTVTNPDGTTYSTTMNQLASNPSLGDAIGLTATGPKKYETSKPVSTAPTKEKYMPPKPQSGRIQLLQRIDNFLSQFGKD